jgi:hypothetical protein
MKTNKITYISQSLLAVVLSLLSIGCDVDDPVKEEVPELITEVTLTFTPVSGGDEIVAKASDPDGEGVQPIQVDVPVVLEASKTYTLSVALINGLVQSSEPEYNVTEEVEEEGEEHMFFFSWTNDVFSDPDGNGNIDNRSDAVNYEDEDVNGLPLGLVTSWTTATSSSGSFKIILKHQPEQKSATSDSTVGETDVDVTFPIAIE